MALPVIEDAYLCTMGYVQATNAMANVFCVYSHVTQSTEDVGNHVIGGWTITNGLTGLQSEDVQYTGLTVTPLDGTSLPTFISMDGTSGLVTDSPYAVQTAVVFTLKSLTRGRSGRGRLYLGGIPSEKQDTGGASWDPTFITNCTNNFENFTTDMDSNNLTLQILSRKLESIAPVATVKANAYLGTQRRRARREQRP